MGYPIYKLLRAVNRQYPNNGFINYVDVREDMYDSFKDQMIDEDLRDLINETIQEVYKDVAIDEVYSFPTVPGQNQYVLPEDCDLRDIQEVTRTYQGWRGPLCPPPGPPPMPTVYTLYFEPNGGTGVMEPMECNIGESITLPECEFEPPEGKVFDYWIINGDPKPHYNPGDTITMEADFIASPVWTDDGRYSITFYNAVNDDKYVTLVYKPIGGTEASQVLYYLDECSLTTGAGGTLGAAYEYIDVWFEGEKMVGINYLNTVYTQSTRVPIVHPRIEPDPELDDPNNPAPNPELDDPTPATPGVTPDPEQPGDGGDGGDDNPLDDLIVDPIDNGDGGDDNPLDGDDEQTPATPSVTPEDESPLG